MLKKSLLKMRKSFLFAAVLFHEAISFVYADSGGGNGSDGTQSVVNPLKSATITEFIMKIIDVLLIFATPIIVFFIFLAGFKFVTAGGNEGKVGEARAALTWAVIGGVIILGAKLIMEVIKGTITAL